MPPPRGPQEERKITPSPARDTRLVLGDPATTAENGTTLTVISYESFSTVRGAGPGPENSLTHLGPGTFELRPPDGTRLQPEEFGQNAKVGEPALRSMNHLPGERGSGFVTFQTPAGERPDFALYNEQFVLAPTIAWEVPKRR